MCCRPGSTTRDSTTVAELVRLPTAALEMMTQSNDIQTALDKLGKTTATPTIQMPSYTNIKSNVDRLRPRSTGPTRPPARGPSRYRRSAACKPRTDTLDRFDRRPSPMARPTSP